MSQEELQNFIEANSELPKRQKYGLLPAETTDLLLVVSRADSADFGITN